MVTASYSPWLIIEPILIWISARLMPTPIFISKRKSLPPNQEDVAEWVVSIKLKRGFAWWLDYIENAQLDLLRRDIPPLDSVPEGIIHLKWIEDGVPIGDLKTKLQFGRVYEAKVVSRNYKEGTAYITNESFIESGGLTRKWDLPSGRERPRDKMGRFTFWLIVKSGKKKWKSESYYVIWVPPAGISNDKFKLETLDE